jgi:hypothetical protein
MKRKSVITIVLLTIVQASSLSFGGMQRDNVAPSKNPPGSLQVAQTPQFVVFGVDDNKYQDGVEWAGLYMRNRVNPKGTGNPATFDSTPARASFYLLALPAYNNNFLKKAIYDVYLDGNEWGDHTLNHYNGVDSNFTVDKWKAETTPCLLFLKDSLRIPAVDIWGFRTPFLAYNNNVFTSTKELGFTYDCSIEEGEDSTQNGTDFFWPYTLDNGSPGANVSAALGTHPPVDSSHKGLWEIPVYLTLTPPDSECVKYGIATGLRHRMWQNLKTFTGDSTWDTISGKMTGLDYNIWFDFNTTKAEYIAILKYTLDMRLKGNRAPFIYGVHSDFYSLQYISEPLGCATNYIQRKEAMVEFLDYALSKQEVRVVPAKDVIRWMRNPVALGQTFTGPCTLTVSSVDSGSFTIAPEKTSYNKNEKVTLTATPANGYVFDRWSGPDLTGTSTTLNISMYKNIAAKAVFKKIEAILDTVNPSKNLVPSVTWKWEIDNMGSKVLDHGANGEDTFFITFYQAPKPDSAWTYIGLYPTNIPNFKTITGVDVEYKCDNPVIVQLLQTDMETDESYAYYQVVGAKSEKEWYTVKAGIKQFYQPDWTLLPNKRPLNMAKVYGLGLIPAVGEAGDTTTIHINRVRVYYPATQISVNPPQKNGGFYVYPSAKGKLMLVMPNAGNYSLKLFSIKGAQVVSIDNLKLKKVANLVTPGAKPVGSGVYILNLNTPTVKFSSQKIMLKK